MDEGERIVGIPRRCTYREFQSGLKSAFWLDICDELDAWLHDVRNNLEDQGVLYTDKELHRLGGNAEALRKMKIMAEVMLSNYELDQEEESNE